MIDEIGVGKHQHRVLAAELERAADEARAGLPGDMLPGRGRAGELDVVDGIEDRRSERRAVAADDLPEPFGQAAFEQQVERPEGRERRLRVGLLDHPVAGEKGGDRVGHAHREGVVPRRDDADDPFRVPVFARFGEAGNRPFARLRREEVAGVNGVVARHDGDVADLFEGVKPGFPRLELDPVERLVLALEDAIVKREEDLGALVEGPLRPLLLRLARSPRGLRDVGGGGCAELRPAVRGRTGSGRRCVVGAPLAATRAASRESVREVRRPGLDRVPVSYGPWTCG